MTNSSRVISCPEAMLKATEPLRIFKVKKRGTKTDSHLLSLSCAKFQTSEGVGPISRVKRGRVCRERRKLTDYLSAQESQKHLQPLFRRICMAWPL